MATASGSKKAISRVENLPEYQKLRTTEYIPFNLEEEAPAENEFYSDKDTGLDGPALFSTRGTRYEKRSAPEMVDLTTAENEIPSTEYPHTVKVIAARFREDFALECKAVDESSWKHLSYYFDHLDVYHWGAQLLQQVLSCIAKENSTLHSRVLRFAVHLLATDTPRARQLAYFGRAVWFHEEVDHYGEEFLDETVKFMTHRTDVIEKLTGCATKYLEEAKGDSYMPPMWYDDSFKRLTEARNRRLHNPTQTPIVLKHKIAAPLAPTLGSSAEKLHASGHHRRTSSLERHKESTEDSDDRKSDTVIDHPTLDSEIKRDEKENLVETGTIVKKNTTQLLAKRSDNQRQFSRENIFLGHGQKKPGTENSNSRKAVKEPQRSSSDSKPSKSKKKGNNNKRRESRLRDELRISSSPANFHNSRLGHASKLSASRSIFDEDDSIVSVTINGEKRDSPNLSPEIPMAGVSTHPSRGSQDDCRTISNPNMDGVRRTEQSQFHRVMHPYGQSSFPESSQQPWYQGPFGPPPNLNGTSYMIVPNEMAPVPNQYAQWGPMHSLPPMPPAQSYGQMMNTPFHGAMQQDSGPYHSQYDPMAANFQPYNQTYQPYQPEPYYGRKEHRKRYPDDMRSNRRWNFAARSHRREFSRDMSSEFVEPALESVNRMPQTYGAVPPHDANINQNGSMAQGNNLLATGVQTGSVTFGTILQAEEKTNETGTASVQGFQYPMVYPRVDSTGHVEKASKEIACPPIEQSPENKETALSQHKDSGEVQTQPPVSTQTQRTTSGTSTANTQNNNRRSITSEYKPQELRVAESTFAPSQAAKMTIPGLTGQHLPSSILPRGHQSNRHDGSEDPLKLYINGIHLTDEAAVKILEPYRPVHIAVTRQCRKWADNGTVSNSRNMYTFVTFASFDDCVTAREALSRTVHRGYRLKVRHAYIRGQSDSATERAPNLLEVLPIRRSEMRMSSDKGKARQVTTPVEVSEATKPQEQGMVPTKNAEQENGHSIAVDLAVPSPVVPDHPPIQSRFKKNKNKQKKNMKQQSRDTSIHGVDETTVNPTSPASSLNSVSDQSQSCPTSVLDSLNSKTSKDVSDTKKATRDNSPAGSTESGQNITVTAPKPSHDLTDVAHENDENENKHFDAVGNKTESSYNQHSPNQAPNSPIDIVMTDLPEICATEPSLPSGTQDSPLKSDRADSSSPTVTPVTAQQFVIGSQQPFQQIDMTGDHTSDDSGLSYLSAPESSRVDNGDPANFDTLLGDSDGVEQIMSKYHSDTAIDSSTVDKTTEDKKSEDDNTTKGWDKSVKINTKGSKKKRRKTKNNNSQSINTLAEAVYGNQSSVVKPDDSVNQDQSIAEGSHSPESVKSKKSA